MRFPLKENDTDECHYTSESFSFNKIKMMQLGNELLIIY